MTLEVDKDGHVYCEGVPKHVGVRVGAKLLGFKRDGEQRARGAVHYFNLDHSL